MDLRESEETGNLTKVWKHRFSDPFMSFPPREVYFPISIFPYKYISLPVRLGFVECLFVSQVWDLSVLPDYPYRDDGLLLYDAIKRYVSSVIEARYGR